MKVRELIEELLKCDQELEVVFSRSEDFAPLNYVAVLGPVETTIDYYEDEKFKIHENARVIEISTN